MTKWPMVPLGEVIQLDLSPEAVHANDNYPIVGILGFGRGLFTREAVSGGSISASQLFRVKANQFIYSRLKAFEGAFGVVPTELDGRFVSNEFPTFSCDPMRLDPAFLGWYFRNPSAWSAAARSSKGIGARRERVKPEQLLKMTIPLPPPDEQQRLVKYLDALNAKVDEAKRLRQEAMKALSILEDHVATAVIGDPIWPRVSMEDLVGRANLKNGISMKASEHRADIRCLTLSSIRNGKIDARESKPVPMDARDADPYLVQSNDVYVVRGNGSKDLVGRAGIVEDAPDNVIFPDLLIKIPLDPSRILPDYFVTIWNSRLIRARIEDLAKTTSGIWKINQGHIASVHIPIPPLSVQERIIDHTRLARRCCSGVLSVQRETESELDAMLPAVLDQVFNGDAA